MTDALNTNVVDRLEPTYPTDKLNDASASIGHSACIALISESHLTQLLSRQMGCESAKASSDYEMDQENQLRCISVVRALLNPELKPTLSKSDGLGIVVEGKEISYWLSVQQLSWYANDYQSATNAAEKIANLIDLETPVVDLLCYHLFSMLTLSVMPISADGEAAIERHVLFLERTPCSGPVNVFAISQLARAIRDGKLGLTLLALQRLECALDTAKQSSQLGVAALVSEVAVSIALQAGLSSISEHYRDLTISIYKRWGAVGRINILLSHWKRSIDPNLKASSSIEEPGSPHKKLMDYRLYLADEIAQPLAAITLHSLVARKLLRLREPDVKRAVGLLEQVGDARRHAENIFRGILELLPYSGMEEDRIIVDQMVEDVLHEFSPTFKEKAIFIDTTLTLGDAAIRGSSSQMRQVVANLVKNAIEALLDSKLDVKNRRIEIATRQLGSQEISICVKDNGLGINPCHRDRIFHSTFTTKEGNSGMGLTICRAIARAHHGDIQYSPRTSGGAIFEVRVPSQC